MKSKHAVLFALLVAMLTFACGGKVENNYYQTFLPPGSDADTHVDNETGTDVNAETLPEASSDAVQDADAQAEASAEAEAGTDADATSDADAKDAKSEASAESGVDADTEAGIKIILTISGAPGSPTEFNPGETGVKPHKLQFCTNKKIELAGQLLYIQTISVGAKTQGSMGTRYFRNIKLMDGTTTAMGPTELKTGNTETMPQRAEFHDIIAMDAGTCKILDVVMDIWNVEDAPGELYNQVYQIQDIGNGAIVKADGDEPVDRPITWDEILWTMDSNSAHFTILPLQPVLEVKTSTDTFASDIIVAGKDTAYLFSKQDVCNLTDNPVTFTYPYIQQACDGAGGDFFLVNVTFEGITGNMSSSAFDSFQIAFASGGVLTNVTVPAKSCLKATLSGRTQPVIPSINFPGDNTVSRSGHAPCLRLVKFAADGGVQIPTKYTPTDKPNPMVIRKSEPILTMQNLANTVIMNGMEQDHYKWQLGADGTIAWKQIMFHVVASNQVSFGNYRLYKGGLQLPTTEYSIMDAASGQDLKTTSWSPTYNSLLISFKDEQTITGSGEIYILRATSSGPGTGQHMMIKPLGSPPNELITGWVQDNTWAGFDAHPDLFVVQDSYSAIGYFIWSDLSELPHNGQTQPSSKDWTTAWLVEDLTQATTLSN